MTSLTHAQDEVRFMRIRTRRHELMISPGAHDPQFPVTRYPHQGVLTDERYLLAVPTTWRPEAPKFIVQLGTRRCTV